MKTFNIAKHHYLINGLHLPVNSVYGKITVKYRRKDGIRQVFTKNGKVYTSSTYKTVTEEVTYYCDNFKPTVKNKILSYNIHVWDSKNERWIKTSTSYYKYHDLGEFLVKMFEKNDIRHTTKCIPWIDGLHQSAPQEKKAQVYSDQPFRVSVGYALSRNVMTCHNINHDGWAYDNSYQHRHNI